MNKSVVLLLCLLGCGDDNNTERIPPPHVYDFCTYHLDNICVLYADGKDVDENTLLWTFNIMEEKVNVFYPGLNLSDLAEQFGPKLEYRWADGSTEYQGTYDDLKMLARVNLRRAEGITNRMKCMDRYYISSHELLHFIAIRYIDEKYRLVNNEVPYIFVHWALENNIDPEETAEQLIYEELSPMCGY